MSEYDPRNHRGPRYSLHYRVADVADAMGVSYSCLYAKCKKSRVNLRRMSLKQLVDWINQHTKEKDHVS